MPHSSKVIARQAERAGLGSRRWLLPIGSRFAYPLCRRMVCGESLRLLLAKSGERQKGVTGRSDPAMSGPQRRMYGVELFLRPTLVHSPGVI